MRKFQMIQGIELSPVPIEIVSQDKPFQWVNPHQCLLPQNEEMTTLIERMCEEYWFIRQNNVNFYPTSILREAQGQFLESTIFFTNYLTTELVQKNFLERFEELSYRNDVNPQFVAISNRSKVSIHPMMSDIKFLRETV